MRSNSILVSGGTPHGLNEAGADLVQGNVVIVLIMLWGLLLRQWRGFEDDGQRPRSWTPPPSSSLSL